jgi:hypothetical protein
MNDVCLFFSTPSTGGRMRFLARLTLLAIFVLSLQDSHYGQSMSTVEGVVLEAGTDRPLEKVTVSAKGGPQTPFAETDSEGRFKIEIDTPGRYRLAPFREGLVYARPERLQPREPGVWVELSAGQKVTGIQLRMVRGGSISGRVMDATGRTFPGTTSIVWLYRYRYDDYGNRKLAAVPGIEFGLGKSSNVRMDDRGEYRFYDLPPGEYIVQSGNSSAFYYPGTSDRAAAVPVRLEAGGELKLNNLILPNPKPTHQVRFIITGVDQKQAEGETFLSWGMFLQNATTSLVTSSFVREIPDPSKPIERNVALAEGPHEYLLSLSLMNALYYANVKFNVESSDLDQPVHVARAPRLSGAISYVEANRPGQKPPELFCKLHSDSAYSQTAFASSSMGGCLGAEFTPGQYSLEFEGMPRDAYVASAKAGEKDILTEGLQLDADTELQIVIRSPGGMVGGAVTNSRGEKLSDAVVALVPDGPRRAAGPLYRSVISDVNGNYEIHGVAPGSYHIFAWTDLEGAAYRNAEFMKEFDDRGQPVKIESAESAAVNLTVLN